MSALRAVSIPAAVTQQHISDNTAMGANLTANGATFRVWAPNAKKVYVIGDFNKWTASDPWLLQERAGGHWTGFLPEAKEGTLYQFWVEGEGGSGRKRDPYARELEHTWPNPRCVIRSAASYPWQDWTWRTPEFRDLIVYELHVGTFFGDNRERRVAKFLDVANRVEYLADLGVNAVELMPIVEYNTPRSAGYNGSDLFSPEMDYEAENPMELKKYLAIVNDLLTKKGKAPTTLDVLAVPINQMKALIEICHSYGLAVILDVVYNHASSDLKNRANDPESIYFFDQAAGNDPNDSQYFTREDHCGPMFAFWKQDVRQFLIDNARFFVEEYHVDGFRYDQVAVIDRQNAGSGWLFCQDLNDTINASDPSAINIAEYWGPEPAVVTARQTGGAGFHAEWHDGLRHAIRGLLGEAAAGRDAQIHFQPLVDQLRAPGFRDAWRAVQYVESHDTVNQDGPRIASLAGGGNSRSWYATSRSRVATGILLTAPGIPMYFMGQEFYEDKRWSDSPSGSLIFWDGLNSDRTMINFHRFTRELTWLRRRHPALRAEGVATILMDDFNRVLAYQRWVPDIGRDVIVVSSLNESTQYGFRIPFPSQGFWFEVFNSDVYENWVNPMVAGNGGGVQANGPAYNSLGASAEITIPANAILVFARDQGD
ncbi:MAG TPA: alpha-amylase family glycosyl hydrolase [Terriglobales bacterium]|nr:alpha-amylase family glycosyl hydrolase [Terriglobales bacterium]